MLNFCKITIRSRNQHTDEIVVIGRKSEKKVTNSENLRCCITARCSMIHPSLNFSIKWLNSIRLQRCRRMRPAAVKALKF